jgi:hypothetical protein
MTERAKRIVSNIDGNQSLNHIISNTLRAVAKDFPEFRTAEKPNDWEKGYHCVIETLHDIAYEIENLQ